MDNKSLTEQVHRYLRLALPLMSRQHIPITPKNYWVWYTYVAGADGELSRTIDAMLKKGEEFSEEKNEALYRQFCEEKHGGELRQIREALQEALRTILEEVQVLTGQTEEYESFVSRSVDTLSEDASAEEIKSLLGKIVDKAKTLESFGRTVRHKLKETTEALEELKKDFEQVKTEAYEDFLTRTPNRKAFNDKLALCIDEASSGNQDLSLLLIDIDDFKRFNDKFGHLIGDEVLKFTARQIREIVKGRDFLARFGGEEFAVILPQTPLAGAAAVGENIRSFFAAAPLKVATTAKDLGTMTVSVGAAHYRQGESSEELLQRSDRALYAAKNGGKNSVVILSDANDRCG